ncbi:uncharacterized protein LOC144022812 [Festucalex cinctus]
MKDINEDQRDERELHSSAFLANVISWETSRKLRSSTMENLASIRSYFGADAYNLLEELVKITSSEIEQSNAEKMFMRQFVLLGMENRVPPCLSPKDIKLWLLNRSNFQQQYQHMQTRVDAKVFSILSMAWTLARCLHLNKMQREVKEELKEENRLSSLLGRKVTLEGLDTYVTLVWPKAQRDTDAFLGHLFNEVQTILDTTQVTVVERLLLHPQYHRATEPLVDTIVGSSLDILLGELEPPANEKSIAATLAQRSDSASKQIGRMLWNALASIPCLRQHITQDVLVCICFAVARKMIQSFFQKFMSCSSNFNLMDVDESLLNARDRVVSAIVQMVFMTNQ